MATSDDLAYLLEVHRRGSLSAAARALKVNQTTIGRRIDALQREVGARLVQMTPNGATLTEAGLAILPEAERIEQAMLALQRKFLRRDAVESGAVRIAATETLASTFLIPRIAQLRERQPGLEFVVIAGNRALDLYRGEAELALRLVRPEGAGLVARKIGRIELGVFAAKIYLARRGAPDFSRQLDGHDVLGYHGELSEGVEAKWFAAHGARGRFVLRVNSVLNLLAAATSGLGIAILPRELGDDPALRSLDVPVPPEARTAWIVYHEAARNDLRIRAVIDDLVAHARDPAAFPRTRRPARRE